MKRYFIGQRGSNFNMRMRLISLGKVLPIDPDCLPLIRRA
jgi:hypothetical protein